MPRYDYRCPQGHITEHSCSRHSIPNHVICEHCPPAEPPPSTYGGTFATRVFSPPAAIHFKGPGFYATDVTGRVDRKRRPNPGDSLPKEYDHDTARLASRI